MDDNKQQQAIRHNIQKRIKHNCDICGGKYTNASKAHHLRSKKHTAITREIHVKTAGEQKEAIWGKTKHNCDICGGKYTNASKAKHMRSKKHTTAQAHEVIQ